MLIDKGYERVRPLQGGIEAWIAAGFEVANDQSARERA
jgi:rhodanese-related sulfurtransferase